MLSDESKGEEGGTTVLTMRLTGEAPAGLIWLEAQCGPVLSAAQPLLVLPEGHHALAEEVLRIVSGPAKREQHPEAELHRCCDGFLADLGLVVREAVAAAAPAGGEHFRPQELDTAVPGPLVGTNSAALTLLAVFDAPYHGCVL